MTPYVSAAAEASAQIFAPGQSGQIRSVVVSNIATAARWIWIFSGTSTAGTLICAVAVKAGGTATIDFGDTTKTPSPLGRFSNGVFLASSTSGSTFAAGGADFRIHAEAI